jgi:RNA polymerase sigma-70 factor (ECF subfamily)
MEPASAFAGQRTHGPRDRDTARNGAASGEASDATLVQQLIAGSAEALAVLYDRYAPEVFAAVVRRTGDRSIASEIVQETFLALWNRAELFDASRGSMRGWLLTIARNRAVDHLRAVGRHHPAVAFSAFERDDEHDTPIAEWFAASGRPVAMATAEDDPEDALAAKEMRASIAAALTSLPPLERSVILLAYAEGLSQSEISAHLGWPIGTVKTRARRALRHLRDWLERPLGAVAASSASAQRLPRPGSDSGSRGLDDSPLAVRPPQISVGLWSTVRGTRPDSHVMSHGPNNEL